MLKCSFSIRPSGLVRKGDFPWESLSGSFQHGGGHNRRWESGEQLKETPCSPRLEPRTNRGRRLGSPRAEIASASGLVGIGSRLAPDRTREQRKGRQHSVVHRWERRQRRQRNTRHFRLPSAASGRNPSRPSRSYLQRARFFATQPVPHAGCLPAIAVRPPPP